MDTVYSGKKKSTVALLVLTERKTRNENIRMVPDRRAETTVQAINALERKLCAEKFGIIYKSITVDNGSELALAEQLEQSCITGDKRTKVYYCQPYSSCLLYTSVCRKQCNSQRKPHPVACRCRQVINTSR